MPFGAASVQGVVQLSLPKLASAPAGTDVTCTGVPDALPPPKLGMLTLGKLKLGMLGIAPQPERAAQLSTKAIARRIMIAPRHPLRRMTYKIGDLRPQFGHHGPDRPFLPRCADRDRSHPRAMMPLSSQHLGEILIRPEPMPNL